MSVVYPSLESPEFNGDFQQYRQSVDDLERLFVEMGVRKPERPGVAIESAAFERVLERCNKIADDARQIRAFISSFVDTDSRSALAQARMSEYESIEAKRERLRSRFTAWIGSADLESLFTSSQIARDHRFPLIRIKALSKHQMSAPEEELAADFRLTGVSAWARLHGNYTSQLTVKLDGTELPMSAVRNLAFDPDRETRRRAYDAELAAWKGSETVLAAAMNGVKGEVEMLCRRRRWASPLEEALFAAHIDRDTLEAMLAAARAFLPDMRRYLRAKAKKLRLEAMAWYDLFAPIGVEEEGKWSYERGAAFVAEQFDTYSQKMGDFARRTFRENWIDAPPKPGKRDGAYCMGVRRDESRILMNYKQAFGSVSTLAHELGHAYHNLCLADRKALQRGTPMTLAETASIFCETIVRKAGLAIGSDDEKAAILEASLQGACQVVVDIMSRFLFEQTVFEARASRELSGAELCEAMLSAQAETYGDGLDPNFRHPYMWAVKPHYYAGRSFYNFPYMFGLLFATGLYGQYLQDRESFRPRYDELLSNTGLASAAELGERFGIDIRSEAFWASSLGVIRQDIDRFVALVG